MGDMNMVEPTRAAGRPDRLRLFEIASEQGGYFTAEQARASGYSFALLSHHVKSGRFIRVRRGLYRLREYPSSPREDVLAAWLAVGKERAVVSHESAPDLLGLCDVIPDAARLTVPRSRRNLPTLPGVKIHTTVRPFQPSDLTYRDGMVVTSATRTIRDVAEAGTAPDQMSWQCARRSTVIWPRPNSSGGTPPRVAGGWPKTWPSHDIRYDIRCRIGPG